jgi:hypothetical protein
MTGNDNRPYGPGWDARRIEKLIYQTDLGMNCTSSFRLIHTFVRLCSYQPTAPFNPKNKDRRLHRHPAFFGTMEECIEDCCEFCPEPSPDDEEEIALQKAEDEKYLRGRIEYVIVSLC